MPSGKTGRIVSGVHGLAFFGSAGVFFLSLPLNRFMKPGWLARFVLPAASPAIHYGLRLAGCIGSLGVGMAMVSIFKHLGTQWNYLGVSRLILSGVVYPCPNALYALGAQTSQTCQYWSLSARSSPNVQELNRAINVDMSSHTCLKSCAMMPEIFFAVCSVMYLIWWYV
jgi:hypothetical protein